MKLITLDTVYYRYSYKVDLKFYSGQIYSVYPSRDYHSFTFWQYCEHLKSQGYKIL